MHIYLQQSQCPSTSLYKLHTCSFHIGDCVDPLVYKGALERSCEVFDYARDEMGLTLSVVDIGGGFEGFEQLQGRFERTSAVVAASVKTVFAAYPNVTVFAEPGRFFARRTSVLLTRVIGKRWIVKGENPKVSLDYIRTLFIVILLKQCGVFFPSEFGVLLE